jgi:2-isopropylmalate synthase
VANSLAGVEGGASEVQVTVNGIGERAGNANLAEVVMSLHSIYGISTNITTRYLVETSKLVERYTGLRILPNTPIVGENAFSHESGIHVHGVLKRTDTFEPGIMTPEMVGHRRRITLGKHAGKHGIKKKLEDAGIRVNSEQLKEILAKVKEIGDKGKRITDADLYTIAEVIAGRVPKEARVISLEEVSVITGNRVTPTAVVRARVRNEPRTSSGTGVGPVDAAVKAVQQLLGDFSIKVTEFRIDAISGGSDALADVTIGVSDRTGKTVTARAASDDIVMASVEALIAALNRLLL